MNNKDVMRIAMAQSATDLNCKPADFLSDKNVIVKSVANGGARKYLSLPFDLNLVSYGNNIVASVRGDVEQLVREYIEVYKLHHCFETPNMHVLNDKLKPYGLGVCYMAEYFLPDLNLLKEQPCNYGLRILQQEDFADLYTEDWSNALCYKRRNLDVLGVGAYEGEKLVGLAGCSADCEEMWQIGVDVLPEYRRKGIASAITSRLATEIIKRNKVPFYCASWSNVKSVNNAIKCGFRPAWVEITAKKLEFINNKNTLIKE